MHLTVIWLLWANFTFWGIAEIEDIANVSNKVEKLFLEPNIRHVLFISFYDKDNISFIFENVNNFLLTFVKNKSTGFCGVSFPPSTSHSRPFRNIRFPSESYLGISNFGNLPDVVNQGREFSFFRYIQIKNVKYWYLHLHKTFDHLIWQVHLKELTLLKLIKYILVMPSRSLQLILKKHYNFLSKRDFVNKFG